MLSFCGDKKYMYKYLLIDFDGTMGETQGTILEAFHTAIKEEGLQMPDDSDIKATIGLPLNPSFKKLFPGINDSKADELVNLYQKFYLQKCFSTLKPMPGLVEILETLKKEGKKMAVVSSRMTYLIVQLCDTLHIKDYFDCFIGQELVKKPKPFKDMAELAMTVLGAYKRETIMIGDTHFDIAMGNNCGIDTCWASYGYGKKETVEVDDPTYTIERFSDLTKIVK